MALVPDTPLTPWLGFLPKQVTGELLSRAQDAEDSDINRGLRLVGVAHAQHVTLRGHTYDRATSSVFLPHVHINDYIAVDHLCVVASTLALIVYNTVCLFLADGVLSSLDAA